MKTIEFFGAPGVGKSYFLEHFGKYNSSNSYQIVQDKTVLSKIKSNSKNELSEKIRWLVYRILNHPQRHLLGEFGKEYVINNQEIVKYIWDLFDNRIDNIYALDTRILLASHFIRSFEKIAAIENYKSDGLCLLDEGIIQRLISLYYPNYTKNMIGKYISIVYSKEQHIPYAAVYCTSSIDVITNNIYGRNYLSGSHKGMTKSEIERYTKGVTFFANEITNSLTNLNIPVLTIDTSSPLLISKQKVIEFINKV